MKAYTDLEQSKILAEFLPIESADMFYNEEPDETYSKNIVNTKYPMVIREGQKYYLEEYGIPCWSLAALLNYLREIDSFPEIDADEFAVTMNISYFYHDVENECRLEHMDSINVKEETFIDACVEMILKLHELNLL